MPANELQDVAVEGLGLLPVDRVSGLGHTSRNNYNAKKPNAEKKQESQSPDPEK
jgi:hypothetical protein